ncbi:hypothetical protein [Streptomyces parvulus]|uniref:hypothetical protein n=1 Tax=Streptomyces parvulus TaxID=146923 RepID=UPI0034049B45
MAGLLPKTLASRLRAARTAAGMAQGAVAREMAARGFTTWRQTTVAKSEAADRPVLFAEVVALAQIYRKEIEYFIYPGTELDNILEQATLEVQSLEAAIDATTQQLLALESDRTLHTVAVGLTSTIIRYRNTGDSDPFQQELHELLIRWQGMVLNYPDVWEAIGVDPAQVHAIDREVLMEVARRELRGYDSWSVEKMQSEGASGEMLNGLSDFLDGKEVSPALLHVLRQGEEWASHVTYRLASLLIEYVNRQHEQ